MVVKLLTIFMMMTKSLSPKCRRHLHSKNLSDDDHDDLGDADCDLNADYNADFNADFDADFDADFTADFNAYSYAYCGRVVWPKPDCELCPKSKPGLNTSCEKGGW